MSQYLVFQLQGPMASWGDQAPGEVRHTQALPGRSALLGLLAAALGIRRDEESRLAEFNRHYEFILCANQQPRWARDYHTVQVPRESRKMRYFTRREELTLDPSLWETTLSRRDYYSDALWLIAVRATPGAPCSLEELARALKKPFFPLYLGRKSHPLALPVWPCLLQGAAAEVLRTMRDRYLSALAASGIWHRPLSALQSCYWWEGKHEGLESSAVFIRRDQLLSRRRWQFTTWQMHQGQLSKEAICTSHE